MSTTVRVMVKASTAKALQLSIYPGQQLHWVPKSVIEEPDPDNLVVGEITEVDIADWFAKKEGIDE